MFLDQNRFFSIIGFGNKSFIQGGRVISVILPALDAGGGKDL